MKKPTRPKNLRVQNLDLTALKQVHGGRGTWCGSLMHCDCGYAWMFECSGDVFGYFSTNIDYCPSCGVSCN